MLLNSFTMVLIFCCLTDSLVEKNTMSMNQYEINFGGENEKGKAHQAQAHPWI